MTLSHSYSNVPPLSVPHVSPWDLPGAGASCGGRRAALAVPVAGGTGRERRAARQHPTRVLLCSRGRAALRLLRGVCAPSGKYRNQTDQGWAACFGPLLLRPAYVVLLNSRTLDRRPATGND
jgi:hypothetical protein